MLECGKVLMESEGQGAAWQALHACMLAAVSVGGAQLQITHILAFLWPRALFPRPRHVPIGLQLGRRQHVQAGVYC